jgi:hypothetical protein
MKNEMPQRPSARILKNGGAEEMCRKLFLPMGLMLILFSLSGTAMA